MMGKSGGGMLSATFLRVRDFTSNIFSNLAGSGDGDTWRSVTVKIEDKGNPGGESCSGSGGAGGGEKDEGRTNKGCREKNGEAEEGAGGGLSVGVGVEVRHGQRQKRTRIQQERLGVGGGGIDGEAEGAVVGASSAEARAEINGNGTMDKAGGEEGGQESSMAGRKAGGRQKQPVTEECTAGGLERDGNDDVAAREEDGLWRSKRRKIALEGGTRGAKEAEVEEVVCRSVPAWGACGIATRAASGDGGGGGTYGSGRGGGGISINRARDCQVPVSVSLGTRGLGGGGVGGGGGLVEALAAARSSRAFRPLAVPRGKGKEQGGARGIRIGVGGKAGRGAQGAAAVGNGGAAPVVVLDDEEGEGGHVRATDLAGGGTRAARGKKVVISDTESSSGNEEDNENGAKKTARSVGRRRAQVADPFFVDDLDDVDDFVFVRGKGGNDNGSEAAAAARLGRGSEGRRAEKGEEGNGGLVGDLGGMGLAAAAAAAAEEAAGAAAAAAAAAGSCSVGAGVECDGGGRGQSRWGGGGFGKGGATIGTEGGTRFFGQLNRGACGRGKGALGGGGGLNGFVGGTRPLAGDVGTAAYPDLATDLVDGMIGSGLGPGSASGRGLGSGGGPGLGSGSSGGPGGGGAGGRGTAAAAATPPNGFRYGMPSTAAATPEGTDVIGSSKSVRGSTKKDPHREVGGGRGGRGRGGEAEDGCESDCVFVGEVRRGGGAAGRASGVAAAATRRLGGEGFVILPGKGLVRNGGQRAGRSFDGRLRSRRLRMPATNGGGHDGGMESSRLRPQRPRSRFQQWGRGVGERGGKRQVGGREGEGLRSGLRNEGGWRFGFGQSDLETSDESGGTEVGIATAVLRDWEERLSTDDDVAESDEAAAESVSGYEEEESESGDDDGPSSSSSSAVFGASQEDIKRQWETAAARRKMNVEAAKMGASSAPRSVNEAVVAGERGKERVVGGGATTSGILGRAGGGGGVGGGNETKERGVGKGVGGWGGKGLWDDDNQGGSSWRSGGGLSRWEAGGERHVESGASDLDAGGPAGAAGAAAAGTAEEAMPPAAQFVHVDDESTRCGFGKALDGILNKRGGAEVGGAKQSAEGGGGCWQWGSGSRSGGAGFDPERDGGGLEKGSVGSFRMAAGEQPAAGGDVLLNNSNSRSSDVRSPLVEGRAAGGGEKGGGGGAAADETTGNGEVGASGSDEAGRGAGAVPGGGLAGEQDSNDAWERWSSRVASLSNAGGRGRGGPGVFSLGGRRGGGREGEKGRFRPMGERYERFCATNDELKMGKFRRGAASGSGSRGGVVGAEVGGDGGSRGSFGLDKDAEGRGGEKVGVGGRDGGGGAEGVNGGGMTEGASKREEEVWKERSAPEGEERKGSGGEGGEGEDPRPTSGATERQQEPMGGELSGNRLAPGICAEREEDGATGRTDGCEEQGGRGVRGQGEGNEPTTSCPARGGVELGGEENGRRRRESVADDAKASEVVGGSDVHAERNGSGYPGNGCENGVISVISEEEEMEEAGGKGKEQETRGENKEEEEEEEEEEGKAAEEDRQQQLQQERACIVGLTREIVKDSEAYRAAEEEEWRRREEEVKRQAAEAQKLRRRKKAEMERRLKMEARQRQRLEDLRKHQRQEQHSLGQKEQIRGMIRANLERKVVGCVDMVSLLRVLGIQVEGGLRPSPEQVSSAYKKALLRFHPDRAAASGGRDPMKQVEAEETFKLMSRMKNTLPLTGY
ncbi:hypothetical protein CBR_g19648 [Chara braunii]|uniref:J domain-containing protein n=1 Tax=Chara braunii TaxID=69332 RepID=A0A388KYK4_CHABU|nr:hypothetical protein CBR_g19648 [Chara braunii]|eukprot:GBG75135.1 hypothetical protein CBR_g19648 [Chara braunii]